MKRLEYLACHGPPLSYLHRLLARRLGLVVLGLLMLLAALGQVGIVGQATEERRHHGAGVHFLLRRQRQEGRDQNAHLDL